MRHIAEKAGPYPPDCMSAPIQLNVIQLQVNVLHSTASHCSVLQYIFIIPEEKLSTNVSLELYIACRIFMCDPCIMYMPNNAAANIIIMFHEAR